MENKVIQQFQKGPLELMLLCLIAQKERYGYELIAALDAKCAALLGPAREGTVYPILYRLEKAGLLRSRLAPAPANGGTKKYYALTRTGKETLRELCAFWEAYTECVGKFVRECGVKEDTDEESVH